MLGEWLVALLAGLSIVAIVLQGIPLYFAFQIPRLDIPSEAAAAVQPAD